MKTSKTALVALTLTALGMGVVVLPPSVLPAAAGQDAQGPPPPQDGAPPPPDGGFGGGGGRRQFGGGRMPFALGTVTAVDPTAKTITITPQFGGGDSQTIRVTDTTQVSAQVTAAVSDLKSGDQVQVQGIPTGITASSLTVGQNPLAGAGGFGGRGGPGAGGGPGGGGAPASYAMATGTVTTTSPLTISLGSGVSLTLKMAADAKVTKFSTVALSGIKVGDRVMSTGQTGDDGTFTASTVGVNVQMGGPGGGGFGGRGGFGRGGFGGGFGGYGRRGGPGGGGPPPPMAPPPADAPVQ